MLFLIDPQNPTKQKCPAKCSPRCDTLCTDVCIGVVYPLYGIDPIPI